MARRTEKRLTAKQAEGAGPGRYADGGGLYLDVDTEGRRRWLWRYTRGGKTREMGLGPLARVGLAQARAERDRWRAVLHDGNDPIDARARGQSEAKGKIGATFGEVADRYIADQRPAWRNAKHAAQWATTLKTYGAPIQAKPVAEVTTDDVLEILRPIWQAKPETAARVRGRIEIVLDAARARRLMPDSAPNVARWKGHLDKLLPPRRRETKTHHAAMPHGEVPAFVAFLRTVETVGARALEFAILTAARSGEVRMASAAEFDLERALWTIPKERMKSGRVHRVPLPLRAVEIVRELRDAFPDGRFVFPGRKPQSPISDMTLTMSLRRRSLEYTAHGFRSSFRDWVGDETHFPRELAEAALAHVISDETEAAYRRGDALDKRREMMRAWEEFIDGPLSAKVVRFPRQPRR